MLNYIERKMIKAGKVSWCKRMALEMADTLKHRSMD